LQDQELVSIINIHLFLFSWSCLISSALLIISLLTKPSDDGIYWRLGGKMLGFHNTAACSQCVCWNAPTLFGFLKKDPTVSLMATTIVKILSHFKWLSVVSLAVSETFRDIESYINYSILYHLRLINTIYSNFYFLF
jgi:hypothetical protein